MKSSRILSVIGTLISTIFIVSCSPSGDNPIGPSDITQGTNAPAAPYRLDTKVESSSSISLGWWDGSDNETGFVIERWDNIELRPLEIAVTSTNITSYMDENLTSGKRYYYRVKAVNDEYHSRYSNVDSSLLILSTPSRVEVRVNRAGNPEVLWQYSAERGTSFRIERCAVDYSREWNVIGTTSGTSYIFEDTNARNIVQYEYRIMAFNDICTSRTSRAVAIPCSEEDFPSIPTNLTAEVVSKNYVWLNFDYPDNDGVRFVFERLDNRTRTYEYIEYIPNRDGFEDRGLTPSNSYTYRVKAIKRCGESGYSKPLTIVTEI
jgi:Fibronectin type III domain